MKERIHRVGIYAYYTIGLFSSVKFFGDIYHLLPIFKRFIQ